MSLDNLRAESQPTKISRRRLLIGAGAIATIGAMPRVASAFVDGMTFSKEESERYEARKNERLSKQYEAEDKLNLKGAIEHNKAKLVKNVNTESGIRIAVMQAQTGQNPDLEMLVNDGALNQTMNFLINSMSLVNNKNGKPVDPKHISSFQQRAQAGQLSNIDMTVIMSGTGGFHTPDGVLIGGGATFNGHPYKETDPRKKLFPLIGFSPDIYYPGEEVLTPTPVTGKFPSDGDTGLPVFTPTAAQSLTAFFAHEASHFLLDAVGSEVMEDLAWDDPKYDKGEYEHKKFVLPLNWYHTAAMAGMVEDQPPIPPSFIVPKLL